MVDIPDTDWRARLGDRRLAVAGALVALVVTLAVVLPFASSGSAPTLTESPRGAGATHGTTTVSRSVLDARTPTAVGSVPAAPPATAAEGPRATRSPPQTPVLTRSPTAASPTATERPATEPTATERPATEPPPTRQTTRVSTDGDSDSPALRVVEIHADAPGADRTNLTREFVVLRNLGSRPLDLGNWTVADAAGHRYRFPPTATLPANTTVTLHTGVGQDTTRHRYWNRSTPVWNNAGDVVVVRDADERERARRAYGSGG